jgi:hypothetical protein
MLILVGLTLLQGPATPRIAEHLRVGMQLVYGSDAGAQPPWTVEALATGLRLKGDADCVRVRLRRQPAPAPAPDAELCVENGFLLARTGTGDWAPQRPVGPRMELSLKRANGDTVRFVTGAASEDVIGSQRVPVVETTMTVTAPSGDVWQRLTERYAVSLTTATSGRFEVPDPMAPSGWRTTQSFELQSIVQP